jgi:3'(2'), 5'-bisphosphate nucleotidase
MPQRTYEHECKAGIEAVLKACQLCQDVQQSLSTEESIVKSDRSPVTVADFGSQAVIVSHLLQAFPADPIVGEEEATVLRQDDQTSLRENVIKRVKAVEPDLSEQQILDAIDHGAKACDFTKRYWTLDPIDGTKGFLRREQYAVALALVENGIPVLGVLGCPNLPVDPRKPENGRGCLFVAMKGEGAFMRPLSSDCEKRIHVDSIPDPADAVFCESVESSHTSHEDHAKVAESLGITTSSYRVDSQCKYAIVARGEASIYIHLTEKRNYRSWIWDHAAGVIVVQEAGGTVTDMYGKPLDFSQDRKLIRNSGVIASNGIFHQDVIASIKQVVEERVK